jgi:hypothetical protein
MYVFFLMCLVFQSSIQTLTTWQLVVTLRRCAEQSHFLLVVLRKNVRAQSTLDHFCVHTYHEYVRWRHVAIEEYHKIEMENYKDHGRHSA